MKDLADQIIGHYECHAVAWDADRQLAGWADRTWHDRFLGALPAPRAILDLGCGSGFPVARHMAACGHHITGVDSSPKLISLCRERLPDHEWLVHDMRLLRLDRHFDGILAWDSFFHLQPEDQRRMFDVFARHAGRSALLMFNTGPAAGEAVGAYRGDPLYHASLDAAEYAARLDHIGFAVVAHSIEDWATGGGRTVWLAQRHDR